MKIVLEVPDNKASFIIELIESIPFIKIKKSENLTIETDTTEYLLSSSANKERLLQAIDRSKRGEMEFHNLIEE